jgi:hypothetical protein
MNLSPSSGYWHDSMAVQTIIAVQARVLERISQQGLVGGVPAWLYLSLGASFLCFSNLVMGCPAQCSTKPSTLLKFLAFKYTSIATLITTRSHNYWPYSIHMCCQNKLCVQYAFCNSRFPMAGRDIYIWCQWFCLSHIQLAKYAWLLKKDPRLHRRCQQCWPKYLYFTTVRQCS